MPDKIESKKSSCNGEIHPKAIEGMYLFNLRKFFEAHEELEIAWNEEKSEIRDLYRGILQTAVTYLHITRGNYDGAIKVYKRSQRWLEGWNDVCRGINIKQFQEDAKNVMNEVERLGKERIGEFDISLFKKIQWNEKRIWICDRCGSEMHEKNCKVTCPNCGNRFDCSDLNLYFD
jgi:predicted metal-dependent hydrolase